MRLKAVLVIAALLAVALASPIWAALLMAPHGPSGVGNVAVDASGNVIVDASGKVVRFK